ncbi:hypothetical protein PENSPDRAFT_752835 [Peniophora sp. CONT]|nr:hypothetical protein PENSPDRAFT_752835 [Peniophora sp. CONT]
MCIFSFFRRSRPKTIESPLPLNTRPPGHGHDREGPNVPELPPKDGAPVIPFTSPNTQSPRGVASGGLGVSSPPPQRDRPVRTQPSRRIEYEGGESSASKQDITEPSALVPSHTRQGSHDSALSGPRDDRVEIRSPSRSLPVRSRSRMSPGLAANELTGVADQNSAHVVSTPPPTVRTASRAAVHTSSPAIHTRPPRILSQSPAVHTQPPDAQAPGDIGNSALEQSHKPSVTARSDKDREPSATPGSRPSTVARHPKAIPKPPGVEDQGIASAVQVLDEGVSAPSREPPATARREDPPERGRPSAADEDIVPVIRGPAPVVRAASLARRTPDDERYRTPRSVSVRKGPVHAVNSSGASEQSIVPTVLGSSPTIQAPSLTGKTPSDVGDETSVSGLKLKPPVTVHSDDGELHLDAMSNVASMTWSGFKTLLNVLHSAAGASAPLDAAVGGIVALVDLYDRTQDNRGKMQETKERLDSLFGILAVRLERFRADKRGKERADSAETDEIESSMQTLQKLLDDVKRLRDRHWMAQTVMISDDEKKLEDICAHILQVMQELQLKLGIAVERNTTEILRDHKLDRLPRATAATYNAALLRGVSRRNCMRGTRVKVLSAMHTWAKSQSPETTTPVFWLSGLAGQGKTTIAYTICEDLKPSAAKFPVISFFCSQQLDTSEEKALVSTLVYNLAKSSVSFAQEVANALENDSTLVDQKLEDQFKGLLLKPWLNSARHRNGLHSHLIIIDALDENEAGLRFGRLFLDALGDRDIPGLRIIFTCRPNDVLEEEVLQSLKSKDGRPLVCFSSLNFGDRTPERTDANQDIELYLNEALPEHRGTPQLRKLADVSDGLFVFASTAVRLVRPRGSRKKTIDDEAKQIEAIAHDIHEVARTVDDRDLTLDRLYGKIIYDAFDTQNFDPGDKRARILALIIFLMCSRNADLNALRIAQLSGVLEDVIDLLVDSLKAVLYTGETEEKWILCYHSSFAQYMLRRENELVDEARPLIIAACWRISKADGSLTHESRWEMMLKPSATRRRLNDDDVSFAVAEAYPRLLALHRQKSASGQRVTGGSGTVDEYLSRPGPSGIAEQG